MKRQLTSILLFSALLMGGASTFVSCTDHESDAAYEVTGSIAQNLNDRADKLNNSVNDISTFLGGTIDPTTGKVTITKEKGLAADVKNLTTDLDNKYTELKGLIDEKNSASTEELKEQINNKINDVQSQIDALKRDIASAKADITDLQGEMANAKTAIAEAKQAAIDAETNAKNFTTTQINAALATAQSNLEQAVSDLTAKIELCKTECNAYTDSKFESLKEELTNITDGLKEQQDKNTGNINKLFDLNAELKAKVDRDSILLDQVKNDQAELKDVVDGLKTKLDTKVDKTDFEVVKAQVYANKTLSEANKADIDSIKAAMVDHVSKTELNDKATELENAFKAADTALKAQIQEKIDKINEELNKLFNTMINMLTGIELQATESPITGYENFSFLGAEAHILGTYYGSTAAAVKLGGVEIADANNVLIDETSGENAGVVYATLNPSNVDFTNCTLKVVDSQGNEAPFTATVVKSNRVLKYGISRAGKSNLYAVKINLNKDNLEAAKTWTSSDAAALKDVAKNVLDKLRQPSTTRLNIGDAATTIAKTFNNRLTAYALQAEQDYIDANNVKQTRTITSKLSLAATAIKPISYNFLKDNQTLKNLDLPSFPTLQSKINFNDYKFNWTPIDSMQSMKTSVTLKNMPNLNSIKIDGEIVVPTPTVDANVYLVGNQKITAEVKDNKVVLDLSKLQYKSDVTIGDIKVKTDSLKIVYDKEDQKYDVEIPMTEFNKIIANINSQVGNMVGNVNNIVDKVKNYADILDGQYIAGINKFIQKFENLLRKSNSLLQPAMFYVTSNGSWNQLAREKEGASYLKLQGGKASTVFVASSYSGEILAPAYKKYVHVKCLDGDGQATGTNLNKVIDGNLHKIGFEATKPGTYEITYEAVDYSGVKVAKKFYVKVVK